jgi:PDZ domain-containing protein
VSRRALTLLLASVLALGLAIAGGVQGVSYVALTPGPAFNTLGKVDGTAVLTIQGHQTYETNGALDLTTVSVRDHITLFEAIKGWFSSSEAVVPREIVFPPDRTPSQSEKDNQQQMSQSHDDATTAALTELGIPSTVTIKEVGKGLPADGKLQVGDILTTVDGKPVTSEASLKAFISPRKPGAPVDIGYTRAGARGTVTLTTASSGGKAPRAIVGITPEESSAVKVDIQLKDVGGPSAGLMFALGIIDKLGAESLTGGKNIAGTGTITGDGMVGEIGGIAQKMRGAKAQGATVFLAPAGNCADAKANKPSGITLVKVESLHGALAALATIRAGGTAPSC